MTSKLSRIILITGALVIVVMVLFPPWQFTVSMFEGKAIEIPAAIG
jgi:hypothetical protein